MNELDIENSVFYAKADRGHLIKTTSEINKGYVSDLVWFDIDPEGILSIKSNDNKNCISIDLKFNDFTEFRCLERQIIGINIQYFYRMIKTCKKKIPIILLIENSKSDKLYIAIGGVVSNVKIQRSQPMFPNPPRGYDKYGCIILAREFQNMCKDMQLTSNKDIVIEQQSDGKLKFSCEHQFYGKKVILGSRVISKTEKTYKTFSQTFYMRNFTHLVKLPNITHNIKIFFSKDLPMKICFEIDTFGEGTIYIKSNQQINRESTTKNSTLSEEDSDLDEY